MLTKSLRYLNYSKCYNFIAPLTQINIRHQSKNRLHTTPNINAKTFIENENKYAYDIMQNNGYVMDLSVKTEDVPSLTEKEYQSVLENEWKNKAPQAIFEMFSLLSVYCSKNNIYISNNQLDDYIDNLTDNIKYATDEELKSIFFALAKWPSSESIRTRNFIEVWAALDDECLKRISKWTLEDMISFLSLFYMVNLIRASDFSYKCLLKLAYKAKRLTKSQLIQTMFFIGTSRRSPSDIHNVELYIVDHFAEFSVDELAICAMGLFKSKTPIRNMMLISSIIDKIIKSSKEIHEVSLTALLKIIRYSLKITSDNKIYDLLECLQHEILRHSIMCNVHLALVGTATLTLHESCLTKIAEKVITKMTETRLKDLERLVLTYGTFNFVPKTSNCFMSQIVEELRNPGREQEIMKHGKSFSCCVAYLGLLGVYPKDLLNRVLCPKFLETSYGKNYHQYGREILTVHNTANIFLKDKNMNLLNEKQVVVLSKKYTDYIPSIDYKKQYNVSEKMFIDVRSVLETMRGGKQFVTGHHVVTHHQRGDIIICNDHHGMPLPVENAFSQIRFGHLCKPPDNNIWIALIIAGRNTMIYNNNFATGHFASKVRELNALGYYATIVLWNIYHNLASKEEKVRYLRGLIEKTVIKKLL